MRPDTIDSLPSMPTTPWTQGHDLKTILVLCEGNHCRSPMAAALLKAGVEPGIQVESAGFRALEGKPADTEIQQIMRDHGFDIGHHRGRSCHREQLLAADLILVMDEHQRLLCESLVPGTRGKVFLLGQWLASPPPEVPDPYLLGPAASRQSFELIQRSVASWLTRINAQRTV